MKYFLITITFLLFFNACSYRNAYSQFDMTSREEMLASYTQSTKIKNKEHVEGVLTATYLNHIDVIYNDEYENFIVGVYLKNPKQKYSFLLNGNIEVDRQEIINVDFYKELVKNPRKWDVYYMLRFKNPTKKLSFSLKSPEFSSSSLLYLKDPL